MDLSILIVEDEEKLREVLFDYLHSKGERPFEARDGVEALALLQEQEFDAVLLDIMLPGLDGLSVCRAVRKNNDVPIIFLTALSDEEDKLLGYELGADDYVTKPFTPMELLARVGSQLRRYQRFLRLLEERQSGTARAQEERVYRIGGLELHEDTVEVFVDGAPVKATPMEFKILLLLMKHPGRVFSADEIYERVWNERAVNTDTVMVHVRNIREKIEINPRNPKYLKVVWGVGYKIEKQQ